jgi:prophage maintenance system killer protein
LSIGLFLARNRYSLRADIANATQTMFRVASGDFTEEELAVWIKQYSFGGED